MASQNGFFDESFFDALRNRTSAPKEPIASEKPDNATTRELKRLVSDINKAEINIKRWSSQSIQPTSLMAMQERELRKIKEYMKEAADIIGTLNATYYTNIKEVIIRSHHSLKNIIQYMGIPSNDPLVRGANLFYPATLKVSQSRMDTLLSYANKDLYTLMGFVDKILSANNRKKIRGVYEDADDTNEAAVGTLLPQTMPDEVLRKQECDPDIDESFAAVAPIMEAANSKPKLNLGNLRAIEAWAFKTYGKKGYIQFRDMRVEKAEATKKKGNIQKKITTVSATYKGKVIVSLEMSDAAKDSSYKHQLESTSVSPDFALSGWIASIYLFDKYDFGNIDKINDEINSALKRVRENKFNMKDSVILECAETEDAFPPFVYDESGNDIMPFTTDIQMIMEDGSPMVILDDQVYRDKSNFAPIDTKSLHIIEEFAETNLKNNGYIPSSEVELFKENCDGSICVTANHNGNRLASLRTMVTDNGVRMVTHINPDFTLTGFMAIPCMAQLIGDDIDKKINHKLKKYANQVSSNTFIKRDRLIAESGDSDKYDLLAPIEKMLEEAELVEIWGESWEDDDVYTEAAKIDDDIKDIIAMLNSKGYKTVYSCSGHPSARLKSDVYKDGIKDGKLYSTARVVFDRKYDFNGYPTGWEPKELDGGKFGIYVKGPTYHIVKGMPKDQFYKWKQKYMYHLEKWAKKLPNAKSSAAKKRYAEKGI